MAKVKSAQEESGNGTKKKRHCVSSVGTSRESIQEAAAASRPSEDNVERDADQENVELQNSHADVVDSEVVMERLREWTIGRKLPYF